MSTASLEFLWGLVIASGAFLILATSIIIGVMVHSRKIKDSENRFRNLFAQVFDALILLNSFGRIIDVNKATCKILKRPKDDLIGQSIGSLVPETQSQNILNELKACLDNSREYFAETEFIDSNDQRIPVEVGGTGFAINGDKYILGSFRDITDRKKSEEKIRKKNIALGHLIELLRGDKKKLKSQIAGELNHVILPMFSKIKNDNDTVNSKILDELQQSIEQLAKGAEIKVDVFKTLTPREIDIGQMIKSGSTSKEIAAFYNIALETVHKHREHIRKKFRITDASIRLRDYLLKNDML